MTNVRRFGPIMLLCQKDIPDQIHFGPMNHNHLPGVVLFIAAHELQHQTFPILSSLHMLGLFATRSLQFMFNATSDLAESPNGQASV